MWEEVKVKSTKEVEALVKDYYGTWLRSYVPSDKSPDVDWLLITPETIQDKVILDLGCCYPNDAIKFGALAKRWVSIDLCPEIIGTNKRRFDTPKVEFLVMNMRKLMFDDNTFDVVLDMSSGDHMNWDGFRECVREAHRVLKSGGVFICSYAVVNPYQINEDEGFGYTRWSTYEEMRGVFKALDFTIVREEGLDITKTNRAGIVGKKL